MFEDKFRTNREKNFLKLHNIQKMCILKNIFTYTPLIMRLNLLFIHII